MEITENNHAQHIHQSKERKIKLSFAAGGKEQTSAAPKTENIAVDWLVSNFFDLSFKNNNIG